VLFIDWYLHKISGREPHQGVKFSRVSRTDSIPLFSAVTETVPEKSKNFHTLKRLSAREDFIDFCRRKV
jgi:hypothetical protein